MFQIRKFMLAIIVIAMFSVFCLSQTRKDLNKEYGESKEDVYLIKPGIILKVDYDNNGQASYMEVLLDNDNIFGHKPLKFIDRKTALEITEKLTAKRRIGNLVKGITFSASCSSTKTESYENVKIAYNLICSKEEPQIKSIYLIWNIK